MLVLGNLKLLTWILIVTQTQMQSTRVTINRPNMFDTHSIVHEITVSPTNKVILSWSEPNCHSISIPSWHRIQTFPSPIRRISLPAEARWTWLTWDAESARWSDGLESRPLDGRSQLQVNVWLRFQCPDIHQAARILDIIEGITRTTCRWSHWAAVPGLRLGLRRADDHFLIVSR